jgi:hypothetical protein
VIACEISSALAETAVDVIRCNRLEENIQVINRKSTALRVGVDLVAPVDVLIAEIVDAGLLGEGILPTVRHAVEHLTVPGARVIPRGATVHAQLVQLPELRRTNPIGEIAGFDLSAFDRFRIPGDYMEVHLPRTQYRILSDPVEVARVDFAAPPPFVSEHDPIQYLKLLPATATGAVHAVAFWFDLQLDDRTTLSTAAESNLTAWGQALQFLDEDVVVTAGQTMRLQASVSDSRIAFQLEHTRGHEH